MSDEEERILQYWRVEDAGRASVTGTGEGLRRLGSVLGKGHSVTRHRGLKTRDWMSSVSESGGVIWLIVSSLLREETALRRR